MDFSSQTLHVTYTKAHKITKLLPSPPREASASQPVATISRATTLDLWLLLALAAATVPGSTHTTNGLWRLRP